MIYVDPLMSHGWIMHGRAVDSCHLFTDSNLEDLHLLAERIGLKRAWFQDPEKDRKISLAHYDLVPTKRKLAVEEGALQVCRSAAVNLYRLLREKPLPLSADDRMTAFLTGTYSALRRVDIQAQYMLAEDFRRLLDTDPEAVDAFGRLQAMCVCDAGTRYDGHLTTCPQRLNELLERISER